MDVTANTFTKQSNAKRAADAMIAKGAGPATEYAIERIDNPGHSDDGRFEIVCKPQQAETAVSEADVAAAEQNCSGSGNGRGRKRHPLRLLRRSRIYTSAPAVD